MAIPRMDSSAHETMAGIGGALTGFGILIMALAPLAIALAHGRLRAAPWSLCDRRSPSTPDLGCSSVRRAGARLRRRSLPQREPASIRMPSQARG
jgi:hypothetical protein